VINENIIENELKRIYCNNLKTARYTTTLLAESSGILAAQATHNNIITVSAKKHLVDTNLSSTTKPLDEMDILFIRSGNFFGKTD
jgi:hypothetical protein